MSVDRLSFILDSKRTDECTPNIDFTMMRFYLFYFCVCRLVYTTNNQNNTLFLNYDCGFYLDRSIVRTIASLQNNLPVQQNLTKYFQDKIRINGPITLAEYMRESLKTYYNSGNVFGSDGDFITSPEISQLYGEVSNQ